MTEYLTGLKEGVNACLENAHRLIGDSCAVLERKSYRSCFMLTQLALEELAKGFKLADKHSKNERFSRGEWEQLTKGKAHLVKLKYLREVEDEWTSEATRELPPEMNYSVLLDKIAKDTPWAGTVDKFREKLSEADYDWRLKSQYIDFDWEKKQWIDLSKQPIFNGIFLDETICLAGMRRAKHLRAVLISKLREAEKEQTS